MGNQRSQFQQRFSNNYAFIEALHDPTHGFVKIYRKKFENYHYVMVIDRRLEQFNNRTFMTDCIKPQSLNKTSPLKAPPKLLVKQRQDALFEYNSMKLQKLKRTLELIKRYQDDLMVPFFSYQVVNGSKLHCTEPVIQLYVEFQNHRLFEYLDVLRSKQLPLKAKEIVYILKSICQGITQLQKMQIEVTSKEINLNNIFTSNQGEIKLNPIDILTKKQHERENLQNIETLKEESDRNPHIEIKKIALGKSLRSSSSAGDKKSSDQRHSTSGNNHFLRQKNILFSSNQSSAGQVAKLLGHKEILRKLLIDLSAFSLMKNSQNKDLQAMSLIINKSSSINEIAQNLQKYGKPCIEGLLVERIYDLEENKNGEGPAVNKELSTSGLSNEQMSNESESRKQSTVLTGSQHNQGGGKLDSTKISERFQGVNPAQNNFVLIQNNLYESKTQNGRIPISPNNLNQVNILSHAQMEENSRRQNLSQSKYQNMVKISQFSHSPTFTFTSGNQTKIPQNSYFPLQQPGIPVYSNFFTKN